MISNDGREDSAVIHQDANIYRLKLKAGQEVVVLEHGGPSVATQDREQREGGCRDDQRERRQEREQHWHQSHDDLCFGAAGGLDHPDGGCERGEQPDSRRRADRPDREQAAHPVHPHHTPP